MPNGARTVRLDIHSTIDMMDLVQVVTDHVGRTAGFGDEALHWVGLAVRECVSNAIIHGNRSDPRKRVFMEFTTSPPVNPTELTVSVRDEGKGFDPGALANPIDSEHLLNPGGRGIFLMRQLMDDVSLQPSGEGGMEVRMVKRIPKERES